MQHAPVSSGRNIVIININPDNIVNNRNTTCSGGSTRPTASGVDTAARWVVRPGNTGPGDTVAVKLILVQRAVLLWPQLAAPATSGSDVVMAAISGSGGCYISSM